MEIVLLLTYFSVLCDISMQDFFDFILFVLKRISIQFHLELSKKKKPYVFENAKIALLWPSKKYCDFNTHLLIVAPKHMQPTFTPSWWWFSKCNVFDVQSTLKCSYSNISFTGFPSKMVLIDNTHSQCVHNIENPSFFIKIIHTQIHQKYSKYSIAVDRCYVSIILYIFVFLTFRHATLWEILSHFHIFTTYKFGCLCVHLILNKQLMQSRSHTAI